jgi:hypothetical protein
LSAASRRSVAARRAKLEARSEIPNVQTRTDSKGRQQRSNKPRPVMPLCPRSRQGGASDRTRLAKPRQIGFDWRIRSENRGGPMATAKQFKAAIPARRASKGPRSKRARPEPRQYTGADREARTRPGRGGGAPNRQRPHEQSQQGTRGVGAGEARTAHHRGPPTPAP